MMRNRPRTRLEVLLDRDLPLSTNTWSESDDMKWIVIEVLHKGFVTVESVDDHRECERYLKVEGLLNELHGIHTDCKKRYVPSLPFFMNMCDHLYRAGLATTEIKDRLNLLVDELDRPSV